MLVANSFDLWQKDTFFSAAEEVQQSADIMESAYRTWLRARREGLIPQHLDELGRELQMALGTAKWQLEEFEKAVRLSYRNNGDDITITRHKQFVSAIEDQISRIETALRESLNVEGKKPFRWVNLDEEECDDLALFLSGTPGTSQRIKDEGIKMGTVVISSNNKSNTKEDCSFSSEVSSKVNTPNLTNNEDINCFREQQESKFIETGDEISCQADNITSNRRAWSSPDKNSLEIVIDNDDRRKNALIEVTPKEKGFKPFFWRSRGENYPGAKMKMINWIDQVTLERKKSETTTDITSVAGQIYTFRTSFDANHFFSRYALALLTSIDNA
ncbi:hypothetical protein DH2020_014084 [Rehmannia glutinosa]|uniref:Syntaxin 6/10/61 N-terminal domain-containing protein n=1 Tax=Rehmannia glutinosa TaxID=99300 RepID=A0ABR0WWA1_REHGL